MTERKGRLFGVNSARPLTQSLYRIGQTGDQFAEDPKGKGISWIMVELPFSMDPLYTNEMLLEFAILEMQSYRAVIYPESQQYVRHECISFPVVDYPTATDDIVQVACILMARAEEVAEFWLEELRAGRVTRDRERIFPSKNLRKNQARESILE
ncbi:Cwf15/Cwc15 cell cycle control protein [Penicillium coprophilum]|uniref:Cwf15/Cwc15 cell cycle control protein n=1 Tax=Penicillium coprophilum TaxID=36646 RepID=UPI00238E3D35|nr:Cwf15/Cwc15 cell cycle control protein [Penicillium coprophilum]KAJ5173491.1 Cwf15/Cwc15 cell cycle control protein [Penicillium coprophilum]